MFRLLAATYDSAREAVRFTVQIDQNTYDSVAEFKNIASPGEQEVVVIMYEDRVLRDFECALQARFNLRIAVSRVRALEPLDFPIDLMA
jgi:hypothetical protein